MASLEMDIRSFFSTAINMSPSSLSCTMVDRRRVLTLFSAEKLRSAVQEETGIATAIEYSLHNSEKASRRWYWGLQRIDNAMDIVYTFRLFLHKCHQWQFAHSLLCPYTHHRH